MGYAGNLAEYQGIDTLFYALNLLKATYPEICLYIYTNDSIAFYKPLIDQLSLGERVRIFSTSFEELPGQLAQVDILLNPRIDGAGVPVKLYNYMAAGKPVVTFSDSSHIIIHGNTGWIVPENSYQSFSDGIGFLIANENLARDLGRNAQKYIQENSSWLSRGEEIIRIYENLCKESHPMSGPNALNILVLLFAPASRSFYEPD